MEEREAECIEGSEAVYPSNNCLRFSVESFDQTVVHWVIEPVKYFLFMLFQRPSQVSHWLKP